ncbi:MAG TPA: DUF1345 domain-containing protein [Pseudolabrys sp.]|jgi:uncharacterized membrane protein|nr:DUF1345 domain-containing protein [Pseudolabrys sp.]
MPIRFARLHSRLLISIALGMAVTLGLAMTDWSMATKLLLGWDAGVVLYLAFVHQLMATCGTDEIRRRAAEDDEGAVALLILTGLSGLAMMGAIVAELGIAKVSGQPRSGYGIATAMFTIFVSWSFVHTIFALHYAHEYYGSRGDHALGGMTFPGRQPPDYWDFLYFSLVIAMTSQVSDVVITSKVIRRIAMAHGALAFFFNVSVIALTVNIISNLI